jgi:hypothetical protein
MISLKVGTDGALKNAPFIILKIVQVGGYFLYRLGRLFLFLNIFSNPARFSSLFF